MRISDRARNSYLLLISKQVEWQTSDSTEQATTIGQDES